MPRKNRPMPWLETNEIMNRAGFSFEQVRLTHIWEAKRRACPKCSAQPHQACRNLIGIARFGFAMAQENKQPHPERIDYDHLKQVLSQRGYQ